MRKKQYRFQVSVLLLSNRSQMRSNVVTTSLTLDRLRFMCHIFALTIDLICNILMNRLTATWNLFTKVTFRDIKLLCKQVSKFCEQECTLNNSYLFLIKGVCYPLLCLFPATEPLWQGTDWTHRWLDGCSFWLPWQIHSVDPPKLPVFSPKCKRFHDLNT